LSAEAAEPLLPNLNRYLQIIPYKQKASFRRNFEWAAWLSCWQSAASRRAERVALDFCQSARTLGRYLLKLACFSGCGGFINRPFVVANTGSMHSKESQALLVSVTLFVDLSGSHECEEMFV
jgi:hypothetical protein